MTIRCPHCSGQLEIVAVGAPQPTDLDRELAYIGDEINYAASLNLDNKSGYAPAIWAKIKELANRGVSTEALIPLKHRVLRELLGLTEEQLPERKEAADVVPE